MSCVCLDLDNKDLADGQNAPDMTFDMYMKCNETQIAIVHFGVDILYLMIMLLLYSSWLVCLFNGALSHAAKSAKLILHQALSLSLATLSLFACTLHTWFSATSSIHLIREFIAVQSWYSMQYWTFVICKWAEKQVSGWFASCKCTLHSHTMHEMNMRLHLCCTEKPPDSYRI